MSTSKISELNDLNAAPASDDKLVIVDTSAGETKRIDINDLFTDIVTSSIDINGGTIDGTVIGGTSPSAITGTTITGTSFVSSGNMTFGDNDRAVFGAGGDLQIYHDTNSYIQDTGDGSLFLLTQGAEISLFGNTTAEYMGRFIQDGAVELYHNGSKKLATTATGIDVTGTATMDGLTVDSTTSFSWLPVSTAGSVVGTIGTGSSVIFNTPSVNSSYGSGLAIDGSYASDLSSINIKAFGANFNSYGSELNLFTSDDTSLLKRQTIASNGDISFYEDTGTTAKFYWDASAESLGIGNSSPSAKVDLVGGDITGGLRISADKTTSAFFAFGADANETRITSTSYGGYKPLTIHTGGSERMRIDSSGKVGINVSSPTTVLHVSNVSTAPSVFRLENSEGYGEISTNSNLFEYAALQHIFYDKDKASEFGRFNAQGNLLVGKSSAALAGAGTAILATGTHNVTVNGDTTLQLNRLTSDGAIATFYKDGTTVGSIGTRGGDVYLETGDTGIRMYDQSDAIIPVGSGGVSRDAAIDLGLGPNLRFKDLYLSGEIFCGTTDSTPYNNGTSTAADKGVWLGDGFISAANYNASAADINRTGTDGNIVNFYKNGSAKGNISITASAVAYNTSSDYRLKENVVSMDNASDRVLALNPVRFNFIADPEKTVDGFLAHEAQEVVPEAVTGFKDAMRTEEYEVSPAVLDGDGNVVNEAVMGTREVPDYQGIDQSKLVPLLTKALQEALERIAVLESKVGA